MVDWLNRFLISRRLPNQLVNHSTSKPINQLKAQFFITHSKCSMGFDQYHEPANELSPKTRTFARMITSLTEEAEAIGWYEQRISLEKDKDAKAIMIQAQSEEFIHFAMDLEFLLRKNKKWRTVMKNVLFKSGDIVKNAEKAEEAIEE